MSYDSSKLFDRPGYIPLSEYVADIEHMRRHGPWKLPLTFGDRLHFFVLSLVAKFSWYSRSLSILHPYPWSPAYTVILKYLNKRKLFDSLVEKSVPYPGFCSYYMRKSLVEAGVNRALSSQGIGRNKSIALSKAIGEMIERDIAGFMGERRSDRVASPQMLERERRAYYYPPKYHRFLLVQKERYPQLVSGRDTVFPWVEGMNLITQRKIFIPQQISSYFRTELQRRHLLQHPTSNGSAGYFTYEGAVLRGIFEVVHRDALLVHWTTNTAPDVIQSETLPEHLRRFVDESSALGISLTILNVTALPIPSVVVVAISEQAKCPGVVMSAAAAINFSRAIGSALEEIVNAVSHLKFDADDPSQMIATEPEPFVSKLGRISRLRYWRGRERVEQFRWFLSGKRISFADVSAGDLLTPGRGDREQLSACIKVLAKLDAGYAPIVYSPKHPIQKELGYIVVQVFIEKAFPLYLSEFLGTLESDRLDEFAQSQGKTQWKPNPLPHPFA